MYYKYFTWSDGKYFRGQDLLHTHQIDSLIRNAIDIKSCETFATIQDYDSDGNVLRCPLYFDIDDSDLFGAYETMQSICNELLCEYEVTPYVWFSGSKGFHIILPIYIEHYRCHEIAKQIACTFSKDIDNAVYRTRSMWRVHGSVNKKTGMFKIPIDFNSSLDSILNDASKRIIKKYYYSTSVSEQFNGDVKDVISKLPDVNYVSNVGTNSDFVSDMMPCLKVIWNNDMPEAGERHKICNIMARFCFQCGMTTSEAVGIFKAHPFWKDVDERDYVKVINSIYKSGRASIGCRSGSDKDLLTKYCSKMCWFHKDIKDLVWPR